MNNPVAIICDGVFAFMRIIALLRLTHSPDLVLYVSWHARTVWGRSGTVGTVWGRSGTVGTVPYSCKNVGIPPFSGCKNEFGDGGDGCRAKTKND